LSISVRKEFGMTARLSIRYGLFVVLAPEFLMPTRFVTAISARLFGVTALLAVASCAAVGPVPTTAPPATTAGTATILTVRPIVAAGTDDAAWRAALLNGASEPAAPVQPNGGTLAEFIVREDAGATLSIVQSNAAGLQAGDRVVVTRGPTSTGRPGLIRLL
jgi:hypothetical protein